MLQLRVWMRKLNKSLQVESILKDLGPRATSCLAYHPQASKFAGCKSILFNLEKKRKNLFIAELEWSLDDKDTANVMEARSVLDSLDIDNDLEVFHFKVAVLWFLSSGLYICPSRTSAKTSSNLVAAHQTLGFKWDEKIVLILIRSSGLVEVWYKTWGLFWWIDSVY